MEEMTVQDVRLMLMEEAVPSTGALPSEDSLSADGGSPGRGASSAADADETAGLDCPKNAPSAEDVPTEGEQRSFVDGAVGLGVDIVEIERMEGILTRNPRFAEQIFSPAEREYCEGTANPATHYALRFAAKEAVVKALGTGFADGIWVRDIEVERAKSGRPSVKLSGRALEVAEEQGVRDLSLSLSYTRTDAVACAMAVTESSVQASEKRKDPMEELARQFKETRKILDDL